MVDDIFNMCLSLNDNSLSEKDKKEIIHGIDDDKILYVLKYVFLDSTINLIEKIKGNDLDKIIDNLNLKQLEEELLSVPSSYLVQKNIYDRREDDLKKVIGILKYETKHLLLFSKDKRISDMVLEINRDYVIDSIYKITDDNISDWIFSKNISDNIKIEIVSQKDYEFKKWIGKFESVDIVSKILCNDSNIPFEIQKKILDIKKPQIINYYCGKEMASILLFSNNSIVLNEFLIENLLTEKNIFNILDSCVFSENIFNMIINIKKDLIEQIIKRMDIRKLLKFYDNELSEDTISKLICIFKDTIAKCVNLELSENEKISALLLSLTNYEMKKILLECLGYFEEHDNIIFLLDKYDFNIVTKNYNSVKDKIIKCGIDFVLFAQYGLNTNKCKDWFIRLSNISDIDEFVLFKKYMFKYFYNCINDIYEIKDFIEFIYFYNKLCPLLKDMCYNNIILTDDDKITLKIIFKNYKDVPVNYEELKKYRYNEYLKLKKDKFNIHDKMMALDGLVSNPENISVEKLKKLKLDNKNSSFSEQIDQLIEFAKLFELIHEYGIKNYNIYEYIFSDFNKFKTIQNVLVDLNENIRKLYETDITINLTSIDDMIKYVDTALSRKYSGTVINLSDKNYILCSHVMSKNEKIEWLINGKSNDECNFISMSPISYKGQKYYYDFKYDSIAFAYDNIKKGSYICSSCYNIGSNFYIKKNNLELNNILINLCGILEASAIDKNNSEILLYRDGLKPCGIILPGRSPSKYELECHKKYNLPFLYTQKESESIENPKAVFSPKDVKVENINKLCFNTILEDLSKIIINGKTNDIYTGREIAIFTDSHAMFEPTIAVLEEIRKRGITEIYSLGDNIGDGPNPSDVLDLLSDYNVKSVAGNSEYYHILGTEFFPYIDSLREKSIMWTQEKIGSKRIENMRLFPSSIDLLVGNKTIALCHFINDVRWDFVFNSTWSYQENFKVGENAKQFLYTNSCKYNRNLCDKIQRKDSLNMKKALLHSQNEPLFNGKNILEYDHIFQGHVHFELDDKLNNTAIHTLRACGMGSKSYYDDNAKFYILKEKKDGDFDILPVCVKYNKMNLICNIKSSDIPQKEKILKFLK